MTHDDATTGRVDRVSGPLVGVKGLVGARLLDVVRVGHEALIGEIIRLDRDRALVQVAYAIGVADPVSVLIDTYGTGRISDEEIVDLVRGNFVLTPRGIIDALQLRRPIYRKTAAFGHFGRSEPEFTWERTDKAAALTSAAGVRVEVPAEGATRR